MIRIVVVLLMFAAGGAADEVYRCEEGGVTYSDQPCGPDAAAVDIETRGNRLAPPRVEPDAPETDTDKADKAQPAPSPCPYISSTRLRTLIIREEVVPGMTREQVREALGEPDASYSGPQPLWTYDIRGNDYTFPAITRVRRIYFDQGCVSDVQFVAP